ncbi:ACP S-malonyltransferase [Bacillus pseudomycoides]|uniref:ACP S-malonyltransferase n=1 Tax=Bacillus TaxID=1386 RepID=UPI00036F2B86|nr:MULTISPECIES: ACP S-malonyltransferase [Bacillus]PDX99229.1 ACP S-malonyltransferase [Bacillus pseudomycoides]PEK80743.1 ACP S-malonyltransferase [Bacillus pseudomycoides]PEN08113.1 ACP S-malonyltransferase [Bacillus pseudomycoides]PGB87544.1 ACP S-malonyltransferase [Bacillus pseudomycoides]PGS04528.1 ACP S-malonyltransferase [Bacillus pseudomycoides]
MKVAILFPGQGSQYIEMGKSLYESHKIAQETFEEANDTLGYDLNRICFEGRLSELNSLENMLPGILTTSVAAFRVFMENFEVEPSLLAGHSLGEFSALTCSGAIDFSDTLTIIKNRSRLAEKIALNEKAGMTIVDNTNIDLVQSECEKISGEGQIVQIACVNSANQVAISGHQEAILKVEDNLLKAGASITPILTGAPFHGHIMKEAAVEFKSQLKQYTFHNFKYPVLSNVNVELYEGPSQIIDNLTKQLVFPVQWKQTMDYIETEDIDAVIEMAPQSILTNLYKNEQRTKKVRAFSFNQNKDKRLLKEVLLGDLNNVEHVDGKNKVSLVTRCLRVAITTRNSNFDEEAYFKGVITPYNRIKEIQFQLDESGTMPTIDEMNECLELLDTILTTKKLSVEKRYGKVRSVIEQSNVSDIFPEYLERSEVNVIFKI